MEGFKSYIIKHGRHFTNELVMDVIEAKWNIVEIERYSRDLVYYNVSSATIGDIVYLTNLFYKTFKMFRPTKNESIKFALSIIGNVNAEGYAFNHWILNGMNVDLNKYI